MYAAQIGKKLLRTEEQMEDLLTSNVFGLWRYLSADLGLVQFLRTATNLDGRGLAFPNGIVDAELEFWPWLNESGAKRAEPDVLIKMMGHDGHKSLILIESKYLSGKSSEPDEEVLPNDQLAREMQNLRQIAQRQAVDSYALVYVTAQTSIPRRDLEESIGELRRKTGISSEEQFYWTTLREVPKILLDARLTAIMPVEERLLADLGIILRDLGLTYFQGIDSNGWNFEDFEWRFKAPVTRFHWSLTSFPQWKFS